MSKIHGSETIILTTKVYSGEENSYGEPLYGTKKTLIHGCLIFPGANDMDFQRLGSNEDIDYTVYLPRGYRQLSQDSIQTITIREEEFVPIKTVREYIPRKNSKLKPTQTIFVKQNTNFGGTANN